MNEKEFAALNENFGMISTLEILDLGGVPVLRISTPHASARIAMQGAQVLEWQPAGHTPVLWLSHAATYQQGRGVRGGIPVCWPWFGAGEGTLPAHGFVRTRMWQLRETSWKGEQLFVRLGIHDDAETRAIWDHAFDLELRVTISRTLRLQLVTRNKGDRPFTITEALHTYFRVGDIQRTHIDGLDGAEYLDKTNGFSRHRQHGAIEIHGETDRIYIDTQASCVIHDPGHDRRILIDKSGSHSTVIWNPWVEKARGFADMKPEEYREMVCVETCNAADDSITVEPGDQYVLACEFAVEST